ncbi:MAG: hypothetical protein ACTHV5_02710, partial [Candidatus Corynebacterium faecigallinarum]
MTDAQMHLNLFAYGCGHHSAAWRASGDSTGEPATRLGDITWWESLAQTAERGLFDAFFLADGQAEGEE